MDQGCEQLVRKLSDAEVERFQVHQVAANKSCELSQRAPSAAEREAVVQCERYAEADRLPGEEAVKGRCPQHQHPKAKNEPATQLAVEDSEQDEACRDLHAAARA